MAAYAPGLRPLKDDGSAFGHAEKPGMLVVNDGKPARGIVSVALESAGYRLYPASGGEDALLSGSGSLAAEADIRAYRCDLHAGSGI